MNFAITALLNMFWSDINKGNISFQGTPSDNIFMLLQGPNPVGLFFNGEPSKIILIYCNHFTWGKYCLVK